MVDVETRHSSLVAEFKDLSLGKIRTEKSEFLKTKTIEWIESSFPSCEIRNELLTYLRRGDVHLKRGYYYREKGIVLFYFKVFDAQVKTIYRKKIGLKPLPGVKITNEYVKRGFVSFFQVHKSNFSHKFARYRDSREGDSFFGENDC